MRNNRWLVEARRQILSPATSLIGVPDFAYDEYMAGTVSSQTGINRFLETRLLSFTAVREKAIAAIKRDEQRRREMTDDE